MIKDILIYPDKRLLQPSVKVEDFGESLQKLITDMEDTMIASNGVGISAIQIGEPYQVFILDEEFFRTYLETKGEPLEDGQRLIYINPMVIHRSVETIKQMEGCLSFPGITLNIERPAGIVLKYQNERGEEKEEMMEGFMARAALHELEHTEGQVFLHYVGRLKKQMVEKKLKKRSL